MTTPNKSDVKQTVRPIPKGYHTVTPWIIVKGAAELIGFLKEAFDAQEAEGGRFINEDGTIGHAEVQIGDSVVMLFDAKEGWATTPSFLRLFVEDADAVYQQALKAGATSVTEVTELAFGDRVGRVADPAGNIWWIQTHLEDVDIEEMTRRATDPAYANAMHYVQESLNRALNRRNR